MNSSGPFQGLQRRRRRRRGPRACCRGSPLPPPRHRHCPRAQHTPSLPPSLPFGRARHRRRRPQRQHRQRWLRQFGGQSSLRGARSAPASAEALPPRAALLSPPPRLVAAQHPDAPAPQTQRWTPAPWHGRSVLVPAVAAAAAVVLRFLPPLLLCGSRARATAAAAGRVRPRRPPLRRAAQPQSPRLPRPRAATRRRSSVRKCWGRMRLRRCRGRTRRPGANQCRAGRSAHRRTAT